MAIVAFVGIGADRHPLRADDQDQTTAVSALPSVSSIQQRIDELEQLKVSDPERALPILREYRNALQSIDLAETWKQTADKFQRMIDSSKAKAALLQASLAVGPSAPRFSHLRGAKLADVEKALATAERELAEATEVLVTAEGESRRRASRRVAIEQQSRASRQRIKELDEQIAALGPKQQEGELDTARRISLTIARQAAQQEVQAYEKELAAYDATQELLPLEHDLAARKRAQIEAEVELLTSMAKEARRRDIETQANEATMATAAASEQLRFLATANEELANQRSELVGKIDAANAKLKEVDTKSAALARAFSVTKAKVANIGHTETTGVLLRSQRGLIPNEKPYVQDIRKQRDQIRAVQMELFDLEDRRVRLTDQEGFVQDVLAKLAPGPDPRATEELKLDIEELAATQRRYVDLLIREYYDYLDSIVDLNTREKELVDLIGEYRSFIDERVLWTRSCYPLWDSASWDLGVAIPSLFSARSWSSAAKSFLADVRGAPFLWLTAVCFSVLFVLLRRHAHVWLKEAGRRAASPRLASFAQTALATLYTLIITACPFVILWFVAWRIGSSGQGDFTSVLAAAMRSTLLAYFPLEFLRQACAPSGLVERHFRWLPEATGDLRGKILQLIVLTLPLVFVVLLINLHYEAKWQDLYGRLLVIASLLIAAVAMHRIFRRGGPIWRGLVAAAQSRWSRRIAYAAYVLAVVFPLVPVVLTVSGYYYSAWQLVVCWVQTFNLGIGLFFLSSLLLRGTLIIRRQLTMDSVRAAVQGAPADAVRQPDEESSTAPGVSAYFTDRAELESQDAQARRIIHTLVTFFAIVGLWLIWVEVTPALSVLTRLPLYQSAAKSVQLVDAATGVVTNAPSAKMVTAGDIIRALIVVGLTLIAVRNLAGLLEIFALRHLSLEKGVRFAITSISRYLIAVIGFIWAFGLLGISWGSVQWIVAAMSVGLGFGLQEIFANFVSGLIILLERPIRIGDVITIGDATGRVIRIQMRATTIRDWDRKELVVPNKELATGRLLNWTLTDNINRIVVTVGVTYDSNPDEVREILMRAVRQHPRVIEDPEPIVLMNEFGSHSLVFSVRVYITGLAGRLRTIHDLHSAIHRALREANVKIPYPQLDLHVRPEGVPPQARDSDPELG